MPSAGRFRFARTGHAAMRWLAGDARDVVELVPRRHPHEVADGPGLLAGLARWRRRIEARRAVAVLRRSLMAAVVPAIVLGLLVRRGLDRAAGRRRRSGRGLPARRRGCAPHANASASGSPTCSTVISASRSGSGTALEIERDGSRRRPTVLDSRVVTGASAAISDSLGRDRAAARPLSGEWATLLAGAAALALVAFALPTAGSGNEPSPVPGTAANRPAGTDQGRSASRDEATPRAGRGARQPSGEPQREHLRAPVRGPGRAAPQLREPAHRRAARRRGAARAARRGFAARGSGGGAQRFSGWWRRATQVRRPPRRAAPDGVEPVAAPGEGGRNADGRRLPRTPAARPPRPARETEGEPATPPSPLAGGGAAQPARGEAQPGLGDGAWRLGCDPHRRPSPGHDAVG